MVDTIKNIAISVIFDHTWTILEPISVILESIYCIVFIEFIDFYGSIRIVFMEGR